jgi:energy-coupling factor transporter ATP-binding protein EcfA2
MKITVFKNLYEKSPKHVDLNQVLDLIKTGSTQKELVERIRGELDKEIRDNLKKKLAVILFGGKFSVRKATGLLEYSRIICLDFDNVVDIESLSAELKQHTSVVSVFLSPSGNGLKALMLVSSDDHAGHVKSLLKEFPLADKSTKDVCRATFASYDPNIWVNPNPVPYEKILKEAYTDEQKYDNLKKWLENRGEQFVSGNRNNFLAKLSGAMNRFGIPIEFAKEIVARDYVKDGTDFSAREAMSVIDSIYNNYREHFNTQSFDNAMTESQADDILSASVSAKDIITLNDVVEDLYRDYDVGLIGGDTTFYPELDNHFRWMKGEVTILTGHSGHGKSTLLNQLLLIRAVKNGEKFGFLSMEQYPPVYFYKELIRSYIGKPLERDNKNRMSRSEYERGMEFVRDHFYYVYPEKDEPTPDYTYARFAELIIKHGVDGVITDPYNSQAHNYESAGGRDDRYIAAMLNKAQRFALTNNVYNVIVAHPKNIGKDEKGYYKEPGADSVSGGVAWWQRSDNMLVFHRPSLPIDYQDPTCTLSSVKIKKQPLNGRPGKVYMTYDYQCGRYYINGINPL